MGSHIFRDFGGEKSLVYRDLKMGRFTVKKLSLYFALLFNNRFALEVCPSPPAAHTGCEVTLQEVNKRNR